MFALFLHVPLLHAIISRNQSDKINIKKTLLNRNRGTSSFTRTFSKKSNLVNIKILNINVQSSLLEKINCNACKLKLPLKLFGNA